MRHKIGKSFRRLAAGFALCMAAFVAGCMRPDLPRSEFRAPGMQIWGVTILKSKHGYRVTSMTRMNGGAQVREKPSDLIASGRYQDWSWRVIAVPSLAASWKAWESDKKVQKREAAGTNDWSHPASNWQQAFERAYEVTSYLVSGEPLPLRATLLLIPDGSTYRRTSTESDANSIPVSFGFYYPASTSPSRKATGERFSALGKAVVRTIYEYQHVVFKKTVEARFEKENDADKAVNDESRSQCWFDSTLLALTSGTHSTIQYDPTAARFALSAGSTREEITPETGEQAKGTEGSGTLPNIKYSDALPWAYFLVTQSVANYFRQRGLKASTVSARDPAAMNAVLSVCRAMTQQPYDLTKGPYPASQIKYVPFFPAKRK